MSVFDEEASEQQSSDIERTPGPDELTSESDEEADEGIELVEPELDAEQEEAVALDAIIAAQFSGPLPPPDILRAYDEVVERGAERIVSQWERETKHRHSLESRQLDAFISGRTRAQWMAFAVIFTLGVGGLCLVALGHSLLGVAGFLTALAAVAASFFRGRRSSENEEFD